MHEKDGGNRKNANSNASSNADLLYLYYASSSCYYPARKSHNRKMVMTKMSTADYLFRLMRDSASVELCHISGGVHPAWYRDSESMLGDARSMHRTGNLFTTLNRLDPQAIDGYLGEQHRKLPGKVCRTMDSHVVRYTRLMFDFDPVRPRNMSSTDEERQEAKTRAHGCMQLLSSLGWPLPAVAMSGNGWHLQYRTALPNTAEIREALGVIYAELHRRFSDDVVEFDRSVRNPARLCCLYGSIKRKGPNARPDRPHRQSWIAGPPDWLQVLPRQVMATAERWTKSPAQRPQEAPRPRRGVPVHGKGDYSTLDVVSWFTAHEAYLGATKENIHRVLCPWRSEHTTNSDGGTIIFASDGHGWPGFFCQHSHCVDRRIGAVMNLWRDADSFCAKSFR